MGVEAHRVMMTWLMHEALSTATITPTTWADFNSEYSQAKVFRTQNIVRASTDSRFTCFSWSKGLSSYTGYISPSPSDLTPQTSNLIVPFRANNTGNFLGWYEVQGKGTNATPVVSGYYDLRGNSFVMNGEMNTNDGALNHRFAIYSTPGNAVIYLDYVRARQACTITKEKGGLMAISMDEFTKTKRTLYTQNGSRQVDGVSFANLESPWVNIDNSLGIATFNNTNAYKHVAFGERANNNSVMTAKLYALYDDTQRSYTQNAVVDKRAMAYYINTTAEGTKRHFADGLQLMVEDIGWNGVMVSDPDSTWHMLLANFMGAQSANVYSVYTRYGNPVFTVKTTLDNSGSSATFTANKNRSVINTLKFFVWGSALEAIQAEGDSTAIFLKNTSNGDNTITITAFDRGKKMTKSATLSTKVIKASIVDGELVIEQADAFPGEETPDGIKEVDTQKADNPLGRADSQQHIYDLQGRCVSADALTSLSSSTADLVSGASLKKGIYVVGGKSILFRR